MKRYLAALTLAVAIINPAAAITDQQRGETYGLAFEYVYALAGCEPIFGREPVETAKVALADLGLSADEVETFYAEAKKDIEENLSPSQRRKAFSRLGCVRQTNETADAVNDLVWKLTRK